MTSRLRYNISGPITIVGFFISGMVDIILVAVASQILPLGRSPTETYSQAFYYAAFSGGIYVILAILLSVTAWGIWFAGTCLPPYFQDSTCQRVRPLLTDTNSKC